MSVALDLGAHACRSLRGRGDSLITRRCRSLVAVIAEGAVQRTWLERSGAAYVPCDGYLAIPGDAAEELAELFPVHSYDLLAEGVVPFADPVTRQLIALVVEGLLPAADDLLPVCAFTQPALGPVLDEPAADLGRRFEFAARLVRLRGYDPRPVNPAVALVLAEMEREQYTGIGICLGAAGIDLALAHRGNPVAALRVARGGRWIDEQLASHTGRTTQDLYGNRILDVEGVRRLKEAASLSHPADDVQRFVALKYGELMCELVTGVERLLAAHPLLVRFAQPLSIVVGGGPARIEGFVERFRDELARHIPRSVTGLVRQAATGELAVARGCLIHAELMSGAGAGPQRVSA